jgi:hypothetical protein
LARYFGYNVEIVAKAPSLDLDSENLESASSHIRILTNAGNAKAWKKDEPLVLCLDPDKIVTLDSYPPLTFAEPSELIASERPKIPLSEKENKPKSLAALGS